MGAANVANQIFWYAKAVALDIIYKKTRATDFIVLLAKSAARHALVKYAKIVFKDGLRMPLINVLRNVFHRASHVLRMTLANVFRACKDFIS